MLKSELSGWKKGRKAPVATFATRDSHPCSVWWGKDRLQYLQILQISSLLNTLFPGRSDFWSHHIIVHQTCSWNLGFGFFICVSKSDKEGKGRHMLVTNHVVNIVNRINICDNIEKQTWINTCVWIPFPFDSNCEHMFHQQEFIFNSPNVRTRPASFARQTLLSIYHQTALLCYLFKQIKNCDICRHFKFCWKIVNSSITTTKGISHRTITM